MEIDGERMRLFMLANLRHANSFTDSHTLARTVDHRVDAMEYVMGSISPTSISAPERNFLGPALATCLYCSKTEMDGLVVKLWKSRDIIYVRASCPCGNEEKVRVRDVQGGGAPIVPEGQRGTPLVSNGDLNAKVKCPCGREVPGLKMRMISHTTRAGASMLLDRCTECGKVALCIDHADGRHLPEVGRDCSMGDTPDQLRVGRCLCNTNVYFEETSGTWEVLTWAKYARAWRFAAEPSCKVHTLNHD
jgi:hypothetical protein